MNIKKLTRRALSFLLAVVMALSAAVSGGLGGTINVNAALSDRLGGLNGLDAEGQKISEQITTANIYSYIKEQGITPVFSSNLTKYGNGDTIYDWAYTHKADGTDWKDLAGGSKANGSVYGKTITAGTEYWVKYPNVEVNGNRYTIKIAVSFDSAYKQTWSASSSSTDDNGGPYVAFFPASPGSIRFSHYARANCSISVYDTGDAESFSGSDVEMFINFMDIDCMQSMSFATDADVAMIESGSLGKLLSVGKADISDSAKEKGFSNSKFESHVKNHIGESVARTVFATTTGNADDSAGSSKYALKVQAKFTQAKHTLNYYFNAGSQGSSDNFLGCPNDSGSTTYSSSNCGYGSQNSGVFMFFGTAADSDTIPDEYAPDITKTVKDGSSYGSRHTLSSGDEEIVFHLSFDSAGWAKDLTGITVTDTLDQCLQMVDGSFKVTSSAEGDVTSRFKNSSSGNSLKFETSSAANAGKIGGTNATYTIEYKARIKKGADLNAHGHLASHANSGMDGYAEIPNKAAIKIAGENVVSGKDSATSGTVYVYWKPEARPDPVKSVDKETLKNADESFTYTVPQQMPADTYPYGYLDQFAFTDKIDDCLVIEEVKILSEGSGGLRDASGDITDGFDITIKDNLITASAKADTLNSDVLTGNGAEKTISMKVTVHYNKDYAYRLEHINQKAYSDAHKGSLTDGTSYDHVDGEETKVTVKNNAYVSILWDGWGDNWSDKGGAKKLLTKTVATDAGIPVMEKPSKTVTDADADNDEKKGTFNVLTDADEVWNYTIKQTIPENTASIYRYSSFKIEDQIDTCLTIGNKITGSQNSLDDITVTITPKGGSAYTLNRKDVSLNEENNKLTFTVSDDLLKGGSGSTGMENVFYGGTELKGAVITVTVPVHIYSGGEKEGGANASNRAVLEKIREHGHMHETEDGTEDYITFENEACVIVNDMLTKTGDPKEGTLATLKTGKVTTKLNIPQIKAPIKNVYDLDDLDWEKKVGSRNEESIDPLKVSRDKNRLTDSTREWYYVLTHNVPKHTTKLFYYRTFGFTDCVDSCLSYDTKDVKVYNGSIDEDHDVTDSFTISQEEGNELLVTAKDDLLTSLDFYGSSEDGNNIILVFPVHISEGEEIYKNEAMQEHNGHLKKIGDTETVYEFLNGDETNKAYTSIDNLVKVKGNIEGLTTKEDIRYTNKVTTQVEAADLKISKEADRFEWEVGETVKYTLVIKNKNPYSIMDRVTVTDDDLPKAMKLNPDDENAICVYASGATENSSSPDDVSSIPETRGALVKKVPGEIIDSVTAEKIWAKGAWDPDHTDEITKQCEVSYFDEQGKTGFSVMVPKQYRGETITVTFLCKVTEEYNNCDYESQNCVNGSVVENTARAYASFMVENEELTDTERIWINTPHLSIEKINGTFKYENKKFVRIDEDETNYKKGDSVHYSLLIQNEHPGTLARDILVTDRIETDGLSYDANSIKVFKIYTNSKGQQVKTDVTGKIPAEDLQVALDNKSMSIRTDFTLRFDGDMPFATSLPENIHNREYELGLLEDTKVPGLKRINPEEEEGNSTWKKVPNDYEKAAFSGKETAGEWESFRRVASHPEEWKNAEIAYIVEYDALISEGVSAGEILRNTADADAENADKTSDPHMITGKAPTITIEKESDKKEYEQGQTGHYVLKVTNNTDETVAKNVVIKDELFNKDAKILPDSVKVSFYAKRSDYRYDYENWQAAGGQDITGGCVLPESANDEGKIYINTGKDLDTKGMIVVTYDVDFASGELVGKNVPNVSAAKADNAYPELSEGTAFTKTEDGLSIRKTSDKTNGMIVTNAEKITYTIEVRNDGPEDKKNVLVRDKIPELTSYVEGSALVLKNGGTAKTLEMEEGTYAVFVLPLLHAYETKKAQFSVIVSDEAGDNDIIKNTGAVRVPTKEETKEGVSDELFATDDFMDTNTTIHPLSNWAVDDNLVAVIGNPVIPEKESDKESYYVGETVSYKVSLLNNAKTTPVKDLILDDMVEGEGYLEILNDSFAITLDGKDITDACQITASENSYHIDFGMNLAAGSMVVVNYKAKALKAADKVTNTAIFNGDEKLKVWEDIRIEDPALAINKEVDRVDLSLGEEAHYEITVTEPTDRGVIKNLVIEDALEEAGLIEIRKDSVKVYWNGEELADAKVTVSEDLAGYKIETGKDLTTKDTVKVTYTGIPTPSAVEFCKETEDHRIDNIAMAYGDDMEPVKDDAFVTVKDQDNALKVTKTSDRSVYSLTTKEMQENGISDTAHYTVETTNVKDGVARNVVLKDAFELAGMEILADSFTVKLTDGKGTADITSDCDIKVMENSYEIITGKNLGLNDTIIVTYDVLFTDVSLVNMDILNKVTVTDDNGDQAEDDNTVTVIIPQLIPEKAADKETYMVDEKAHYQIKVTQDKENILAYNVVIRDELTSEAEGFAILEDSIRILDKDGKDITDEIRKEEDGIKVEKESMEIHTHQDLAFGEFMTVEYDVSFDATFAGHALSNIVKVKADNAPEVSADALVDVPDENGLLGVKSSDPESGSMVKIPAVDEEGKTIYTEGGKVTYTNDEITYTIKISNTDSEDKENILVRDCIPEGTEFVSSEDGEILKIGDSDYFTAVIERIETGESREVSFKVKVIAEGFSAIRNSAEYKLSGDPENAFDGEDWKPTNEVIHYIPEVVTVEKPVVAIEKTSDREVYAVGETGEYSVKVTNTQINTEARNVVITDQLDSEGVILKKDSIRIADTEGKDITSEVKITADNLSYSIETGKNLVYGESFFITYTVEFASADLVGKTVTNTAAAKADNADEVTIDHHVTVDDGKAPVLKISKSSDKEEYKIGDTGIYTLIITNEREGTTAKNVTVKDAFENDQVKINKKSITVIGPDGTTYAKDQISFNKDTDSVSGFGILTGLDLNYGEQIKVTYEAVFDSENLAGKDIVNYAAADADNAEEAHAKNTITVKKDTPEKPDEEDGNHIPDNGKESSDKTSGNVKTNDILIMVLIGAVFIMAVTGTALLIRKRKSRQ